jgi:N-acylglucosamine 2-epimerase
MSQHFKSHAHRCGEALLENIIPFWENYSIDEQNGGYFTCLDRAGNVYDTDKFIWLQARQAWIFSRLYNGVENHDRWLRIAESGIRFLIDHAMSDNGSFYFSTTCKGTPLIEPYNIFSDCFAAMAFSQYAKACGDQKISDLAKRTYRNIGSRKQNPKGIWNKSTGNRPIRDFALPMILSNLVLEMEHLLPKDEVEETIDHCIHEVLTVFHNPDNGLIHEYVSPDGRFLDTFEGRLINPGHAIEAMGFMLDLGARRKDKDLISQATDHMISLLEFGWDEQHQGIFYFLDAKGNPPYQLEWDQKLWWVHLEALAALSKALKLSDNATIVEWYERVYDYTWSRFPDPEYGEWFGYLNRQGVPHLTLKGGKWKGCFHVPRALLQCWQSLSNHSAIL